MKKVLQILCLGCLLIVPAANAIVFDFEDIPKGGNNNYLDLPSGYHGLTWNAALDVVDITNPGSPWGYTGPAHSGQNAILNSDGKKGVIELASGTFVFDGLWIRSWNSRTAPQDIRGYSGASLVYTIPFTINSSWQFIPGNSAPITKLEINGGKYFLVDDFMDSPPATPDAGSTFTLISIGLAALAGLRRRLFKA